MRDWNLSLNYIMLVPPTFVAFQLMKRYVNYLLWIEMLSFLLLSFSVLFQFQFGMTSALYLLLGALLAENLMNRDLSPTEMSRKQKLVSYKLPLLTFLVGITLARQVNIDAAWIGLVIATFAALLQVIVLRKLEKTDLYTFFALLILFSGIYFLHHLFDGVALIHAQSAFVVTVWLLRAWIVSRSLKKLQ